MKVYMSNPDLIYFLFPDHKKIDGPGYLYCPHPVVYFLRENERINDADKMLESNFPQRVLVTGVQAHHVNLNLDERMDYVNFVATLKNLKPAKDLEKLVKFMSDKEFSDFIKITCVTKRWARHVFTKDEKVYKLFEAMMESKKEFIKLYTKLREKNSAEEIFSSVLTFLSRVDNYEEQKDSVSDYYRKVLRLAKNQSMGIKRALVAMISLPPSIPVENRIIGFFLSIKG